MNSLVAFLVLISILDYGSALPFRNTCPKVQPMANFDFEKFKGTWYEILHANTSIPVNYKCSAEAYLPSGPSSIEIFSESTDTKTGDVSFLRGYAKVEHDNPAVWKYSFPSVYSDGELRIMDTDYENYAVLYSCKTIEIYTDAYGWLISRTRKMKDDVLKSLLKKWQDEKIDISQFIYIDQSNCNEANVTAAASGQIVSENATTIASSTDSTSTSTSS